MLTEAGRVLARRASDVLDLVRDAFDEVARAETTIAIAAFPTAITTMLLPLLAQLAPSIRLTIVHAESEGALHALRSRQVDCAITDGHAHEARPRADDLHRTLLRAEPIRLVTHSERVDPSLADYANRPWVLGGASSRLGHIARQACQSAGFVPNVIIETEDHHITLAAIRHLSAASFLPELALTNLPDDVTVVADLKLSLERRIEFVTRHRQGTNSAIATLAQLLTGGPLL